jgi:hypothetical protein
MNTHHTHHTPTHGQGRELAMRWLARQLRWEQLLAELRTPTPPADEEQAA